MRAVALKVATLPREAITARCQSISPKVGTPRRPRRDTSHTRKRQSSRDLILQYPSDGKATLIGVGLRIERRRGLARIYAAGEIGKTQVGKACHQLLQHRLNVDL